MRGSRRRIKASGPTARSRSRSAVAGSLTALLSGAPNSKPVSFEGREAIVDFLRRKWARELDRRRDVCDNSVSIFHEMKNIVVEPDAGTVATEQSYVGELVDGTKNDMHNCNFVDVDADGKFGRVIIWMAGTNPLK